MSTPGFGLTALRGGVGGIGGIGGCGLPLCIGARKEAVGGNDAAFVLPVADASACVISRNGKRQALVVDADELAFGLGSG